MRKRQLAHLRNCLRTAPNHGTVHDLCHGFVHIRARTIETRHEGAFGQQPASINLLKLLHDLLCYLHQAAGYTNQTDIAAEQGARKRQDWLDFNVPGWPMTDYSQRKCPQPCTSIFLPTAMQKIPAQLTEKNRL